MSPDSEVTRSIHSDLLSPKVGIAPRQSALGRVTMPEISVDKQHHALFPENKVWFAEQPLISPPTFDVILTEQGYQPQFC